MNLATDPKPQKTIAYYDKSNVVVDVTDQWTRGYTGNRWPVALSYSWLDLAGINAHVPYNQHTGKTIRVAKFREFSELETFHGITGIYWNKPGVYKIKGWLLTGDLNIVGESIF